MLYFLRSDLYTAAATGLASFYSGYSLRSTLAMSTATFWKASRVIQGAASYFRSDICAAALTGLASHSLGYSLPSTIAMSTVTFWGTRRVAQAYKERITQDLLHLINRCQNMQAHIALPSNERLAIVNEWNRLENICWSWGGLHQAHLAHIRSRIPPNPLDRQQAASDLTRLLERCHNMQPHILLPLEERAVIVKEWNRLKDLCWTWGENFQTPLLDIQRRIPPLSPLQRQVNADLDRLIERCQNMQPHILLPFEERTAIEAEHKRLVNLCWCWRGRYSASLDEIEMRMPPKLYPKPVYRILPMSEEGKSHSQAYRELKSKISNYYNGDIPSYIHFDDRHLVCYLSINVRDLSITTKNHPSPVIFPGHQDMNLYFGNRSCMAVPTFYRLHDVHQCYPERFLRLARRIAPRNLAEVEEIILEIKNLGGNSSRITSRELLTLQQPSHFENTRRNLHKYLLFSRLILYYSFHESAECLGKIRHLFERHGMQDSDSLCYYMIGAPPASFPQLFEGTSDYTPLAETLVDCPLESWNSLMNRSSNLGYRSSEERVLIRDLCNSVNAQAYGVRENRGGLSSLLNIMLEGSLRPEAVVENLTPSDFHPGNSANGPFYVIPGRGGKANPDAYIVPYESDKALAIELLQIAHQRGMLTTEERDDLIRKLHTIPEYIQAHRTSPL